MLPIKNFLLKDHAPTQIVLYSIPVVNVLVRAFQSYHSIEGLNGDNWKERSTEFELKKSNFKRHMEGAVQIQIAVLVASIAIGVLFPTTLPIVSHVGAFSFALALSNFLSDKFYRAFGPITSTTGPRIGAGPERERIEIIGY